MLNLVNVYDVPSARFWHPLWEVADKGSSDPFKSRLTLTLVIVGQYLYVLRREGFDTNNYLDDLVQEAATALRLHLIELDTGKADGDGKLKYTVHNAVARYLHRNKLNQEIQDSTISPRHDPDLYLDLPEVLDARQIKVLQMVGQGHTETEIANALSTSQSTVSRWLEVIRTRLSAYYREDDNG